MSVASIKKLHDLTGMGMHVCQKAWKETGDIEKAIEYLREQGLLKAASLTSRETNEGIVAAIKHKHKAVILKMSCETDFAAKAPEFINLTESILEICSQHDVSTPDDLPEDGKKTISLAAGQQIKENVFLEKIHTIHLSGDEKAVIYYHSKKSNHTCEKACIVKYKGEGAGAEQTAYDIAMHIIANDTQYHTEQDIPNAIMSKERELLLSKHTGKPEHVLAKITESGMKTFLTNSVLKHQLFVKDDSKTIEQLCKANDIHLLEFYKMSVK